MRTLLAAALSILAAAGTAACITLPQSVGEASMFYRDYVGPKELPSAALMRLTVDGIVRVSPGSSCADFSNPHTGVAVFTSPSTKDYSHLHNRKLGVVGRAPAAQTSTEIALEPGKPVTLSYTRSWVVRGTSHLCQLHRTFVPESGVHYHFQAAPVYAEAKCSVATVRLTEPSSPVLLEPTKLCAA